MLAWDTTTILVSAGTLFKSTNEGLNWIQISDVNAGCIEVDNVTQEIYYGFNRTSNMGETWHSLINPNLPASFSLAVNANDIRIKPGNNNILYSSTGVGIYKSTNKGLLWNQLSDGLNRFRPFDVKITPSNPSIIYAVGRQGIHRSNDNAETWKYIGGVSVQELAAVHPENHDIVFVSQSTITMQSVLWKTSNGGIDWEAKTYTGSRFRALAFDLQNTDVLYAVGSSLQKSTDLGDTWQFIPTPAPPYSIQINPQNSSELYLGTGGGLYKSTNGGVDWQYSGLPSGHSIIVLISPHNVNTLYAAVHSMGFFISTDSGSGWEERNDGLASNKFTRIAANPNKPGQIFIGTEDDGICYSNNSGSLWNKLEPPFPAQYINAFAIDTTGAGRLFAASMDFNGVYFLDSLSTITNLENEIDNVPKDFKLYQNYPNPFNPATRIQYEIGPADARQFVSIIVYDVLGREVATLVSEYKEAGKYIVEFNAASAGSGLPSGVYFYRLNAGSFSETKKMILLR